MKFLKYTSIALLSLSFVACGNRKTEDENNEVEMTTEGSKTYNQLENDSLAGRDLQADEQRQVAGAKMAIENYYNALGRQEYREAYDMRDTATRGVYDAFEEVNTEAQEISVTFLESEDKDVKITENGAIVTLPVRLNEIVTSNNTRSKTGTITVIKDKTDTDDEYRITKIDLKED